MTVEALPTSPVVTGAIRMDDGDDLVTGPAGQPYQLTVHYSGQSSAGQVNQMRVQQVKACDLNTSVDSPWEAFSPEKVYTIPNLPVGTTDFTLNVQFRDDKGNESLLYCGTIGLEGTQSTPAP
jgi:hypothetical protein